MSLLIDYRPYILIAVLVGMIFLPKDWRKNKLFQIAAFLLAFSAGYELIMSEPVTNMPGTVNRFLNQDGAEHNENSRYYQDPIDRSNRLYKPSE
ncbi:hypothetical protein [Candidatus Electronema sp. TJ]|uniref:hypothetical protein n=1 Tax=Candidatus Electronema sp. TJ TaxID=3401573 RepID=UPI003AA9AED5